MSFVWSCIFVFKYAGVEIDTVKKYFLLMCIDWIVNGTLFTFFCFVIYCSEKITSEGKLAKNHLYKILHRRIDQKMSEVVNTFIYQIDNSDLKISTGFFNVDYKLLFQVKFNKKFKFAKHNFSP